VAKTALEQIISFSRDEANRQFQRYVADLGQWMGERAVGKEPSRPCPTLPGTPGAIGHIAGGLLDAIVTEEEEVTMSTHEDFIVLEGERTPDEPGYFRSKGYLKIGFEPGMTVQTIAPNGTTTFIRPLGPREVFKCSDIEMETPPDGVLVDRIYIGSRLMQVRDGVPLTLSSDELKLCYDKKVGFVLGTLHAGLMLTMYVVNLTDEPKPFQMRLHGEFILHEER
jgi:hypothetical protein